VSPPQESQRGDQKLEAQSPWQLLHAIDPQRALKIHPNDTYRIERALDIWRTTGQLPSSFEPVFDPVGDCLVLFLDRDTDDLKRRIAQRAGIMIDEGWIQEVKNLSPAWRAFASEKLIGYREIEQLVDRETYTDEDVQGTINTITSRTYTYARRQRIFWRGLKKDLIKNGVWFEEFNLTLLDHTLYIKQLLEKINTRTLSGTDAKQ
jgi:tRNA dimethylallyltransferase